MPQSAVVMNMFYTGLGIARSLSKSGIPVIGLSADRTVYGNFTSSAKTRFTFDSREEPEKLSAYLLELGRSLPEKAVLFPTRDHDVVFLDRYREQLEPYFSLVIPSAPVVQLCLNKWQTYESAVAAGVASPQCWLIENEAGLAGLTAEITFPCVLKPLAAHHWRKDANWELVGGRKAFQVNTLEELRREYMAVARADSRALVQEMIPGDDTGLTVAACYMDRQGKFRGGFTARKLLQIPSGFGTGCIVETVDRPELLASTVRLLESIHYTGVAEVEYKWDPAKKIYSLIEINPRPWDQHRLGAADGCDLIRLAYRDHTGAPAEAAPLKPSRSSTKWVAEDALFFEVVRLVGRRDPAFQEVKRLLRGRRTYAIWSLRDPLPFLAFVFGRAIPWTFRTALRRLWSILKSARTGHVPVTREKSV